jgi:hypothetical protein
MLHPSRRQFSCLGWVPPLASRFPGPKGVSKNVLWLLKTVESKRFEIPCCLSDQLQPVYFFNKRPHVGLTHRNGEPLFSRYP